MSTPVTTGSAALGRRAAAHRLLSYIRRNKRYYAVWLATTLAYSAGFVAIPWLVGWAIEAYETGLSADEIVWRAEVLTAVAVVTTTSTVAHRVAYAWHGGRARTLPAGITTYRWNQGRTASRSCRAGASPTLSTRAWDRAPGNTGRQPPPRCRGAPGP